MDRQLILIGILLAAALIGSAIWFSDSLPFAAPQGESQIDAEYAGVRADIARLEGITLDTAVIQNQEFRRLVAPQLPSLPTAKPGGRIPYLP
ncbi:MAG: hypothetical protein A2847_02725 [Candidatus Sungbacteria bacterium RIFCSPHIGHO2_01_FULL_50_25]|uniref:Uncharacterized protein n=1 Tax=Candidatus Sungbacteria bacterium RIFCSPHIGHO2_01_FULL_50_25 TaxID=1802265 RepID=A0A1G2KBU6_9BACT|nr:MAG: hypothetical protein A2847_02725 [Candidatus Sungbacteria bacterium RIFCSPHIGHO2_01_FULL_50_25]